MPAPSTVTLILVGVLVVALAGYLSVIAWLLRQTSFNLGTVLVGVRAIEHATRPVADVVGGIGDDVGAMESALRGLVPPAEQPADDAASG